MNEFKKVLSGYADEINKGLDAYLSGLSGVNEALSEATRYAASSGGKRLRPIITLAFCELCGGERALAYPAAYAVEAIHTYSLIHDDLPCMDDDDFRRGKKSCHAVYGEGLALLAGDALITQAFEAISSEENVKSVGCENAMACVRILARAAGASGMVSGQVYDVGFGRGPQVDADKILDSYRLKTGALFSAAASLGAICAGKGVIERRAASDYGENLGAAFQIADDLIDYRAGAGETGLKPSDAEYVSLVGEAEARERLARLTKKAVSALEAFKGDVSFLSNLAEFLIDRSV